MIDYSAYFKSAIERVKTERRYRIFKAIERGHRFPKVRLLKPSQAREITVWCGVDYLGLSQHPLLKATMTQAIEEFGVGSGGTRNIGGNIHQHVLLEETLAQLHHQEAGLLFTSGYVANEASLKTLGKLIPSLTFLSDQQNHMSIIEGIRGSACNKIIFKHNDLHDLEEKLKTLDPQAPKLIIFESVYSMSGSIAPIQDIVRLARRYNAMTYVDEVHALAVYGSRGGGISELTDTARDIDIIQGTLSKGFGLMGGYITGKQALVDAIRLYAHGFIFTTSLPPQISICALKALDMTTEMADLRRALFQIVDYLKVALQKARLPILSSDSHIIPLWIGDPIACEHIAQRLLDEFNIYIQAVNYPTVRRGEERFRISPTAKHSFQDVDYLVEALKTCWPSSK